MYNPIWTNILASKLPSFGRIISQKRRREWLGWISAGAMGKPTICIKHRRTWAHHLVKTTHPPSPIWKIGVGRCEFYQSDTWLVGQGHPSEKYESHLGWWLFPTEWENKIDGNQTSNQIHSVSQPGESKSHESCPIAHPLSVAPSPLTRMVPTGVAVGYPAHPVNGNVRERSPASKPQ